MTDSKTKMPKCQKISTPLRHRLALFGGLVLPEFDELDYYDLELRQEDGSVVRRGDDVAEWEAVLQRHRQDLARRKVTWQADRGTAAIKAEIKRARTRRSLDQSARAYT